MDDVCMYVPMPKRQASNGLQVVAVIDDRFPLLTFGVDLIDWPIRGIVQKGVLCRHCHSEPRGVALLLCWCARSLSRHNDSRRRRRALSTAKILREITNFGDNGIFCSCWLPNFLTSSSSKSSWILSDLVRPPIRDLLGSESVLLRWRQWRSQMCKGTQQKRHMPQLLCPAYFY